MRTYPIQYEGAGKGARLSAPREFDGVRVDRVLFALLGSGKNTYFSGWPRRVFTESIRRGALTVNGAVMLRSGYRVRCEDILTFRPSFNADSTDMAVGTLNIVFEDEHLWAVEKPAGLITFPIHDAEESLFSQIRTTYPQLFTAVETEWAKRAGIVHRLDRQTSGLVLVAKSEAAYLALKQLFREHTINKVYQAVVFGTPRQPTGRIEKPLVAKRGTLRRMTHGGRSARGMMRLAITEYRVLRSLGQSSLIEARPLTGRTHQIRVHMAALGYPLLGDLLYGSKSSKRASVGLKRHLLHACELSFQLFGNRYRISSPLPESFLPKNLDSNQ